MTRNRKPKKCDKCGGTELYKDGRSQQGNQLWRCKKCRRRGTLTGKLGRKKSDRKCILCEEKHLGKGLCRKHFDKARYLKKRAIEIAEKRKKLEEEILKDKKRR